MIKLPGIFREASLIVQTRGQVLTAFEIRDHFGGEGRVKIVGYFNLAFKQSELSWRLGCCQWAQPGGWNSRLGDDDFLSASGSIYQASKLCLCFMDIKGFHVASLLGQA